MESRMWDQWARTTRFLQSARIALARESRLWETLELDEAAATLRVAFGATTYAINADGHRKAVGDEHLLCAMILLYSYAIAESAAASKLSVDTDKLGPIENWGQQLLTSAGNDWTDVLDGKPGIAEVAVYRNAISHGAAAFESRHVNRMANVGASPAWSAGDPVRLDYDLLKTLRSRLKSLVRSAGIEPPAPLE